jgi:hypothetical protein
MPSGSETDRSARGFPLVNSMVSIHPEFLSRPIEAESLVHYR